MCTSRWVRTKVIPVLLVVLVQTTYGQTGWNPNHKIGTINGVYHYTYNQVPAQLVELFSPTVNGSSAGLTYQWEISNAPISGFSSISGAVQASYTYSSGLTSTSYLRRKTTNGSGQYIFSNTIKLTVVSSQWEDKNYVKEYEVNVSGVSTWTAVDQLTIGPKLENTTYLDGLGRGTQKISRETATPDNPNNLWGDMVQFAQYDAYGRQPVQYLPYTTTSQSGKYKTNPVTEQAQYYSSVYNESFAYTQISFDNSPLHRVTTIKQPGISWNASPGRSAVYDLNTSADDVRVFSIDYIQGNPPVYKGVYPEKTLYKMITADENGKLVVEYTDRFGKLILRKVQLDDNPAGPYDGWICTYNVYDDFGMLRYQVQPEGVKYLSQNGWSFAGANGTTILDEQCFQYNYDDKGRVTWKKAPGAQPLRMLYDVRDRLVLMQDGNQAALSTPQWTANIYDELDRPVVSTLYNSTQTVSQLQADINNAPVSSTVTITNPGTVSVTVNTHLNPITSASLNNASITTVLKYQFYDNYSFNAVKAFNTAYTNLTAYNPGSDPHVQAIAKTQRTISMPTGDMTRVLNSTTFLAATHYYDERGALIQTLADNIKQGVDINTLQYHFDGRVISTCNDHTVAAAGYVNYKTLTKYLFDKLGRVASIQKQFGSNPLKTMASYSYDDAGRLKRKVLDPNYTAGGNNQLEELLYSYNLHNQITGINKDYALKNPATYNKWGHFFGLYLGFDNRDNVFSAANLTGQVTGLLWNTQGDDAQRRYNFTYDNAGRLTNASFSEKKHTADSWSNTSMDFSVSGNAGKISYDLNGNLLNMLQKGVIPGTATPIVADNLSYTYHSYSNRLMQVTDNMPSPTINGQMGDFKDGTNGASPDYVYDANGNVVIDLNKNAKDLNNVAGANGIKYNFLDKPEQIRIAGKGTITIVYSAAGEKLQRSFTPEPSGTTVTTTYINQYVYQESGGGAASLQFINFEEGRIRVITPTSQGNGLDGLVVDGNLDLPNGKRGAIDYFIMDYQQNVRMVLTEEVHVAMNTATMETAREALEESIFGQPGANNEVELSRADTPPGWSGNSSAKVSRLGALGGQPIGPNTLQKVMAGDVLNATVLYYHQGSAGGNATNMVNPLLLSLGQAISGGSAVNSLVKNNVSNVTAQLGGTGGFINTVQPGGSNPSGNVPQAFLTIIFFDERFNFIPGADGGVAQQQVAATVGSNGSSLTLANVKAPKNGYAYVYISNQSNNHVYFDDMQVHVTTGNIIEENHYYAYGLRIAALSSRKLGNSYEGQLKNNYLYQGAYAELDEDIGWNDFALRNYDAQIGRWVQQDPYQEFASPYVGMGNDPINLIDPSGGSILSGLTKAGTVAVFTIGGAIIGTAVDLISGGDGFKGTAIGAGIGLAAGFGFLIEKVTIRMGLSTANAAINVIDGAITSSQAGNSLEGSNRIGHGPSNNHAGNTGQEDEWKYVSIILAESHSNGAGSGRDWVRNPSSQGIHNIEKLARKSNEELLNDMRYTIRRFTTGVLENVGDKMVNHFAENTGSDFSDKILNNHITASSQFQEIMEDALESIKSEIQRINFDFTKYKKQAMELPAFPKWELSSPFTPNSLYTLVGGTQYGCITLVKYKIDPLTNTFIGVINVTIKDDFGVSASDVKKAEDIPFSKGIRAMWYLQHIRGFKPFITVFGRYFKITF